MSFSKNEDGHGDIRSVTGLTNGRDPKQKTLKDYFDVAGKSEIYSHYMDFIKHLEQKKAESENEKEAEEVAEAIASMKPSFDALDSL